MNTDVQDIEMLQRAILGEAQDAAEQIRAEAKKKADDIRKRAEEQAEQERRSILDQAKQDAERLRTQAAATAQLKARSSELAHREEVLDRVFSAVKEKLPELEKRPDYDQIAAILLREALTQLRVNKAQVRADKGTADILQKKALDDLSKDLKGQFTMGDPLEEGTGVVVDAGEGKLHYDNTLQTRLQRLQSTLRAQVYKVLTGE
jgi:vacuolar-type H+-ATPase subunit E/Vma4